MCPFEFIRTVTLTLEKCDRYDSTKVWKVKYEKEKLNNKKKYQNPGRRYQ
uniref:Uncharacterized protein n=1 Tax=Rhizophagus irregularis (strain DAOM 181602 / DAOM 197198 / MUCL 43194) TaxID=747089 RepID=U9TJK9_RHIID